jgi:uncharacterized protein YegP (UPF0339 family)
MAQEFYVDSKGEHRWRVIGRNFSDVVGDSAEGYVREIDAAKGLLALVESVDIEALRAHVARTEGRGDSSTGDS